MQATPELKTCTKCGEVKPLSDYHRSSTCRGGFDTQCKVCWAKRNAEYYAEHADRLVARKIAMHKKRYAADPNYYSDNALWTKFRMTRADYDAKLAEQGGECPICKTSTPRGRWGRFAVDHDHECCPGSRSCGNCVRALLCDGCNNGTGIADSPNLLRRRTDYVEEWRAKRLSTPPRVFPKRRPPRVWS